MLELHTYPLLHRLLISLAITLLFSCAVSSQNPISRTLGSKDGLPTNIIYKIDQDSLGQMWIATDNGVCKYDGQSFEEVSIESANDHFFAFMDRDTFGNLWMLNISGQLFVNVGGQIIDKTSFSDNNNTYIRNIIVNGSYVWIDATLEKRTSSSIYCYKISKKGDLKLINKRTSLEYAAQTILKCNNEIYLSYFLVDKGYLAKIGSDFNYEWTKELPNSVYRLIKLEQKLFIGLSYHDHTLHLINLDEPGSVKLNGTHFKQLLYLGETPIVLTNSGFHFVSYKRDSIILSEAILPDLQINHLYQCSENLLWISTTNKGIVVVPSLNNNSYKLNDDSGRRSSVTSLYKQDSILYVGASSGAIYGVSERKVQFLGSTQADVKNISSIGDNVFFCNSRGLWTYQDEEVKFVFTGIAKDFVAVDDSLVVFALSYATEKRNIYNAEAIKVKGLQFEKRSYAVEEDSSKILWIGNITGLYFYHSERTDSLNAINHLPYNISDIEIVNDSIAYVSTFANGVYRFSNYVLDKKLELPSDKILKLHSDENNLAIACEKGAIVYNFATQDYNLISSHNYLTANNVSCVFLDDSKLWVGGEDGLALINLAESLDDKGIDIKFESFSISGEKINLSSNQVFEYGSKNLLLDFSAVTYSTSDEISYEYLVEGMDTTWIPTQTSEVRLPSVNPGNYNITIRALDGAKVSEPYSFPFTVKKAWYNHWWIRVLGVLLLLGIGYWVNVLRTRKRLAAQKAEIDSQRRVDGMKMTALQNHMNPHFISNALYSIQNMIENNNNWEASEYTANFADLIRRSMRYATMERISLAQEIEFLKVYLDLEATRTGNLVQTKVVLDDYLQTNKKNIMIPPLLIQPLIENSFKHANLNAIDNPRIEANFEHKNNAIYCTIKDNGIGFNRATSKDKKYKLKSTGLDTVKERLMLNAKQFGKDDLKLISIESRVLPKNSGTTITVRIDY